MDIIDSQRLIASCHFADMNGVLLALKNGADVNYKNEQGDFPLRAACWTCAYDDLVPWIEIVKLFIQNGADVNAANKAGVTPLYAACCSKKGTAGPELVRLLLSCGAQLNQEALICSAQYGNVELVKVLLSEGADVNGPIGSGVTALMGAARHGHISVIKLLLAKGADVNAKDNNGISALMNACMSKGYSPLDCVKELVENGADVNAIDNRKWSSLEYVEEAINSQDSSSVHSARKIKEYLVSKVQVGR